NTWLITDDDASGFVGATAKLAHFGTAPVGIDVTRRDNRHQQQSIRDPFADHPDEILIRLFSLVPPNTQLGAEQHGQTVIQPFVERRDPTLDVVEWPIVYVRIADEDVIIERHGLILTRLISKEPGTGRLQRSNP